MLTEIPAKLSLAQNPPSLFRLDGLSGGLHLECEVVPAGREGPCTDSRMVSAGLAREGRQLCLKVELLLLLVLVPGKVDKT